MRIPRAPICFVAGAAVGIGGTLLFSGEAPRGTPPLVMAGVSLFGLATLAFVAIAGAAILNRDHAPHLWRAAALLGAAIVGLAGGAWGTRLALGDRLGLTLRRAEVIMTAINNHTRAEEFVPHTLEEMVPRYLTAVPPTAYRGRFRFERHIGHYLLYFFDDFGVRHTYDTRTRRWKAE